MAGDRIGFLQDHVEAALRELRTMRAADVHRQTAKVWYGRVLAALRLGRREDAQEFAHEAIEHAALSGDMPLFAEIHHNLRAHGLA